VIDHLQQIIRDYGIRGFLFTDDHFFIDMGRARAIIEKIVEAKLDYRTGVIYTTNRRVWEHDDAFKQKLKDMKVIGVDMETATIFTVGVADGDETDEANGRNQRLLAVTHTAEEAAQVALDFLNWDLEADGCDWRLGLINRSA
jgi:hypothetical protein